MQVELATALDYPDPNYTNPETRGPTGIIIGVTLISLVTIILVLRLYTRQFISKGLGLDDVLISLAYFPTTAYTILAIVGQMCLLWNRHTWDVPPDLYVPSLKLTLAIQIIFALAATLTKLSILAIFYRLTTAAGDRKTRTLVQFFAVLTSVNFFIFTTIVIFQCRPISDYWTISLEPQQCINQTTHLLVAGTINTVLDFALVFLPIRTVVKLELPRKQRVIIAGLLGTGIIASASGVPRTYYTYIFTTAPGGDHHWFVWIMNVTSEIELDLGIICASLPAVKPFFARYLPDVFHEAGSLRRSGDIAEIADTKSEPLRYSAQAFVDSHGSPTWMPNPPESAITQPKLGSPLFHKPLPSRHYDVESVSNENYFEPIPDHRSHNNQITNRPRGQSMHSDPNPTRVPPTPQRVVVRFSNRFATFTEDPESATVVIMYQGDDDVGQECRP